MCLNTVFADSRIHVVRGVEKAGLSCCIDDGPYREFSQNGLGARGASHGLLAA